MNAVLAARGASESSRWRTVDIVVVAVLAVAFGVVFYAWNAYVWVWLGWIDKPWEYAISGMWLMPAVVAPLIVRKPGAALFAEMVAAAVSTLLGSQWGPDTLLSGFVQGAAAELVFAFTLYRVYTFPVLALAALASAAAAWIHDWALYYAAVDVATQILVGIAMGISAVVIVAGGSVLIYRALRSSGVLEGFPA